MHTRSLQTTLCALMISALMLTSSTACQSDAGADLVIMNGTIFTVDDDDTRVEAIAVENGAIIFVGSDAEVQSLIGRGTQIVDLEGRFAMPGLIDSHVHLLEANHDAAGTCELAEGMTEAELFDELEACPPYQIGTDWIQGWGHSIHDLLDLGYPPIELLDSAIPDEPALIMEQTSHSVWANSAALSRAGITIDTPDPPGGVIMRDAMGQANGILLDAAAELVFDLAFAPSQELDDLNYDAVLYGVELANQNGITSIVDARTYWKRNYAEAYIRADTEGELSVRATLSVWAYASENDELQLSTIAGMYDLDASPHVQITQVKLYSDGLIDNTTAALLEPYLGVPLAGPTGLNYFDAERLKTYVMTLENAGFDAHIHAIGDRAVREALDAIEATAAQAGERDRRHRLTHLELMHPADVPRFAALGVFADFQMSSDFVEPEHKYDAAPLLGDARIDERSLVLRDVWNTGAEVVLSSDYDVGSLSPFIGMQRALTRGDQSLPDLRAAIWAYTRNPARLLRTEHEVGSLEVGKLADVIVLDRDPFAVDPSELGAIEVLLTIFDGEEVYRAKGL